MKCGNFDFRTEKSIIASLLILLTISFLACDGAIFLRGRVVESYNVSGRVVDLSNIDSLFYVKDAKITFYARTKDSSFAEITPRAEFLSDSVGYFNEAFTVAPFGKRIAALIASKDGFTNDTVFFEYKSLDTVNVILNLKKIND